MGHGGMGRGVGSRWAVRLNEADINGTRWRASLLKWGQGLRKWLHCGTESIPGLMMCTSHALVSTMPYRPRGIPSHRDSLDRVVTFPGQPAVIQQPALMPGVGGGRWPYVGSDRGRLP